MLPRSWLGAVHVLRKATTSLIIPCYAATSQHAGVPKLPHSRVFSPQATALPRRSSFQKRIRVRVRFRWDGAWSCFQIWRGRVAVPPPDLCVRVARRPSRVYECWEFSLVHLLLPLLLPASSAVKLPSPGHCPGHGAAEQFIATPRPGRETDALIISRNANIPVFNLPRNMSARSVCTAAPSCLHQMPVR